MTILLDELTEPVVLDSDDDSLEHYYCCNEDVALCGADIRNAPDNTYIDTPLEDDCIVCVELAKVRCKDCGEL